MQKRSNFWLQCQNVNFPWYFFAVSKTHEKEAFHMYWRCRFFLRSELCLILVSFFSIGNIFWLFDPLQAILRQFLVYFWSIFERNQKYFELGCQFMSKHSCVWKKQPWAKLLMDPTRKVYVICIPTQFFFKYLSYFTT